MKYLTVIEKTALAIQPIPLIWRVVWRSHTSQLLHLYRGPSLNSP
jgi:hypothetical protein